MVNAEMPRLIATLRRPVGWASLRTLVASVFALSLVGYYLTLGFHYWEDSRQAVSTTTRVGFLVDVLDQDTSLNAARAEEELVVQEMRLEQLSSAFETPRREGIVALLATAARESEVRLSSMVFGHAASLAFENVTYQTQPVTINLRGSVSNLNRFLDVLSHGPWTVSVSALQIATLELVPAAQLQLLFHFDPQFMSDEQGQ